MRSRVRAMAAGVIAATSVLALLAPPAFACLTNADCTLLNAEEPICSNGACRACMSNADCMMLLTSGPNCDRSDASTRGSCFRCDALSSDNGCPPGMSSCNLLSGLCGPPAPDAALDDGGMSVPDGAMGPPDGMVGPPMPDAAEPDANAPQPDAGDASGQHDAATETDATAQGGGDAQSMGTDATTPNDALVPGVDGGGTGGDDIPDVAVDAGLAGQSVDAADGRIGTDGATINGFGSGGMIEGGACSCDVVGSGGAGLGGSASALAMALLVARRRRRKGPR